MRWCGPPTRSTWWTWPPSSCAAASPGRHLPAGADRRRPGHFFREGNLTALRELALLWLADRVDEELLEYMAATRSGAVETGSGWWWPCPGRTPTGT